MKIRMKSADEKLSMKEAFEAFAVAQTAKGVSEKTLSIYNSHFRAIGNHLDTALTFDALQQSDLDGMIVSMRKSGLAHNSISSYLRVFRTFLHWRAGQGYGAVFFAPVIKRTERNVELLTERVQTDTLFISADDFLFERRFIFFWHDRISLKILWYSDAEWMAAHIAHLLFLIFSATMNLSGGICDVDELR